MIIRSLVKDHAPNLLVQAVARYAVDLHPRIGCSDSRNGGVRIDLKNSFAVTNRKAVAIAVGNVMGCCCFCLQRVTHCGAIKFVHREVALSHNEQQQLYERELPIVKTVCVLI